MLTIILTRRIIEALVLGHTTAAAAATVAFPHAGCHGRCLCEHFLLELRCAGWWGIAQVQCIRCWVWHKLRWLLRFGRWQRNMGDIVRTWTLLQLSITAKRWTMNMNILLLVDIADYSEYSRIVCRIFGSMLRAIQPQAATLVSTRISMSTARQTRIARFRKIEIMFAIVRWWGTCKDTHKQTLNGKFTGGCYCCCFVGCKPWVCRQ